MLLFGKSIDALRYGKVGAISCKLIQRQSQIGVDVNSYGIVL